MIRMIQLQNGMKKTWSTAFWMRARRRFIFRQASAGSREKRGKAVLHLCEVGAHDAYAFEARQRRELFVDLASEIERGLAREDGREKARDLGGRLDARADRRPESLEQEARELAGPRRTGQALAGAVEVPGVVAALLLGDAVA